MSVFIRCISYIMMVASSFMSFNKYKLQLNTKNAKYVIKIKLSPLKNLKDSRLLAK